MLPVQLEASPELATWLGVDEVVLIREDLLPQGGGKKRRSLHCFAAENPKLQNLYLLSYAGSHTAFTLAQLLPGTTIHLYGTEYGGGPYERQMTAVLNAQKNIEQKTGSTLAMTLAFHSAKRRLQAGDVAMKVGGSVQEDKETSTAVDRIISEIGSNYHHVAAVASGDLLKHIYARTGGGTGVLTQPGLIRLVKLISLRGARGLRRSPLAQRIAIMKEVQALTGNLWDPIFMGSIFSYLKQRSKLPARLCIWVTCPTDIHWTAQQSILD